MPLCKFCQSPQRSELEAALACGELTQTEVARRIGGDRSAVIRHVANHLTPAVRSEMKADNDTEHALNVLDALTTSHAKTLELLETAMDKGDIRAALDALRTEVKQLKLVAQVTGQTEVAPTMNFLLDARYMQVKQVMLKVLEPFPELKERMADALLDVDSDEI